MTDADRKNAEAGWKKARDNIQLDYEEVRRLDHALTRLLGEIQRIRNAIEEGHARAVSDRPAARGAEGRPDAPARISCPTR